MQNQTLEPFKVIGISVRTTNENGQSATDIANLWQRFMGEQIQSKIPNKQNDNILSIYTNYEDGHMKPYDTILGCRVTSLDGIPENMIGLSFEGGSYMRSTFKGDLTKGLIYNAWLEIWEKDLQRVFTADFEEYGAKAQNPNDAEVDIFVAVK